MEEADPEPLRRTGRICLAEQPERMRWRGADRLGAPVFTVHLSFDLHQQLPAATVTAAGSPSRLSSVQGGMALRQTWTLVIADVAGQIGRIAGTVV